MCLYIFIFVAEPSAPRNLVIKDVTSQSIAIEWDAPEYDGGEPVKQYLIVMRETGKKKYKKVGKADKNTLNFSISSNLEEDHEYYVRVYAENKLGVSVDSAESSTAIRIPVTIEEKQAVKEDEQIPEVKQPVHKQPAAEEDKQAVKEDEQVLDVKHPVHKQPATKKDKQAVEEEVQIPESKQPAHKQPPRAPVTEEVEPATGESVRTKPVNEDLTEPAQQTPVEAPRKVGSSFFLVLLQNS